MTLVISIVVNIILIIYLLYIYLIKGELRENKNVEYANVEYAKNESLGYAKLFSEIEMLNNEITNLKFTHQELNKTAEIIKYGLDGLRQRAVQL